MKKLYVSSLSKLLSQTQLSLHNPPSLQNLQAHFYQKYKTNIKLIDLVRLPNSQLRTLLKIPCPVSSLNQQSIDIFKVLRYQYNIQQENVCQKCNKKERCSVKTLLPNSKKRPTLADFIFFLLKLAQCKQTRYTILRWSSAFKISQCLRIILKQSETIKQQSTFYRAANQQFQHSLNQSKNTQIKDDIFKNRRFHL